MSELKTWRIAKPIQTDKVLDFAEFRGFSPVYVETGTCYGGSLERAIKAGYKYLYSVEAHRPFYYHCKAKFEAQKNIILLHGKSYLMLPEMLTGNNQCVIFLDAHPAGPETAGHDDLMEKGEKSEFHQDNIITKELAAILRHRNDHLIIIDDQNGANEENVEYMATLRTANPNYKFFWYDEQAGERFYKNKVLVCIP